ncbi:Ras-related protein [Takifugu flavidus]|uniref:small monomeric GTPase n=2 Tax=Takifugu flavidus TaxID=433684 RepID=A0A5C6NWK0_9TELE|nr:Ras-related protein [Takifugu flavidus]
MGSQGSPVKSYDYLLKFLLVGDSDVGKGEILDSLQDGSAESPYAYSSAPWRGQVNSEGMGTLATSRNIRGAENRDGRQIRRPSVIVALIGHGSPSLISGRCEAVEYSPGLRQLPASIVPLWLRTLAAAVAACTFAPRGVHLHDRNHPARLIPVTNLMMMMRYQRRPGDQQRGRAPSWPQISSVAQQQLRVAWKIGSDWDTSGQGRFCTIFRSYSRGAQGILLVYDITNRWSFDGIDRWIREIDEHAPGVPRILVGNRLHLAFKRQVPTEQARAYAEKNGMTFFEVSPLCNFNVIESFTELSRIVLMRHGMEKFWRPNRVFSLQDLCCRAIVSCTPVHLIDKLPLPVAIKSHLKSFSMANGMNAVMMHGRSYSLANPAGGSKGNSLKRTKSSRPPQSPPQNCTRSNCKIS